MNTNHNHKFQYDKFVSGFASCKCGTYKSFDVKTKTWTIFNSDGTKAGA